jgi:hypothetical protein
MKKFIASWGGRGIGHEGLDDSVGGRRRLSDRRSSSSDDDGTRDACSGKGGGRTSRHTRGHIRQTKTVAVVGERRVVKEGKSEGGEGRRGEDGDVCLKVFKVDLDRASVVWECLMHSLVGPSSTISLSLYHSSLPITVSLYPSITLSLYHSITLSLYPSITLSLYPTIPLSLYPSIPQSLYLFIPISLYPSIPQSLYFYISPIPHTHTHTHKHTHIHTHTHTYDRSKPAYCLMDEPPNPSLPSTANVIIATRRTSFPHSLSSCTPMRPL